MATGRDLACELLERASDDLRAAEVLLDATDLPDSMVGFHCQQAAEKSLKAVLASRGRRFPHTHDLGLIAELCEKSGGSLPESLSDIDRLTPFAVRLRYSAAEDLVGVSRQAAVRWAKDAVAWARGELEDSA
jgi:HEPN domain-containing protein